MNDFYGYMRISEDQSEEKQIFALREYGVEDSCIYKDRLEDLNYPAYYDLLDVIRPGDTVVLRSLDQLGDNYENIISKWEKVTKEHDAAIVVLDMELPDMAKALSGQFVSEFVLDVMNYVEQNRKVLRRQKQREGIRAAHERGVKFGSPPKMVPEEFKIIKREYEQGRLTVTDAAARLHISRATFRKWMKNEEIIQKGGF
ncbi:MAG: recombinase family protein [Clostridiales bacterium]|nr:recombinase family protein [Clostridiales bacterium]